MPTRWRRWLLLSTLFSVAPTHAQDAPEMRDVQVSPHAWYVQGQSALGLHFLFGATFKPARHAATWFQGGNRRLRTLPGAFKPGPTHLSSRSA